LVFSIGLGIGFFLYDTGEVGNEPKTKIANSKRATSLKSKQILSGSTRKTVKQESENYKVAQPPLLGVLRPEIKSNKLTGIPNWVNNSVHVLKRPGFVYIAIVIDDMGINKKRSDEGMDLEAPLTLSFLSYAPNLIEQTKIASSNGHELLVHLPMEPLGDENPGPGALLVEMTLLELNRRLELALEKFPNFVGINNHMGSRFTSDLTLMNFLLSQLKDKGYLFLDSVTTSNSVALKVGEALGTAVVARDVFLDDIDDEQEVRLRLAQAELIAKETGTAIAIGHPRKATLRVLREWMLNLEEKKIQLVPLSALAQIRLAQPNRERLKNNVTK
tara:strand:- start:353 stop:1345 length:993 start_codon:yes stop_codon:yes gene_type:complete